MVIFRILTTYARVATIARRWCTTVWATPSSRVFVEGDEGPDREDGETHVTEGLDPKLEVRRIRSPMAYAGQCTHGRVRVNASQKTLSKTAVVMLVRLEVVWVPGRLREERWDCVREDRCDQNAGEDPFHHD